jgi:hypothetical protein
MAKLPSPLVGRVVAALANAFAKSLSQGRYFPGHRRQSRADFAFYSIIDVIIDE